VPMNGQLREYGSLSGSSNSPYDALEDEDTDDSFGRRMIQEMNQERVQSEGRRPQAFRKARIHPRGGLTLENLERVAPSNNVQPAIPSHSSLGSISSGLSEPPLNVPREWGRKGRRNNDWLRRITMESPKITERDGEVQGIDWASEAADVPLPSLEDSPSSRRGSTRGTPAASIRRQQVDLNWELNDDLNSGSFIESTPMPARNTALDDIRQREFEEALNESSVYRSAYPTPPRGTSGPRESKSPPPPQSLADTWTHPAEQEIAVPKRTEQAKPPTNVLPLSTTQSASITGNGPPSPIAVHKSSHTLGRVDRAVTPQAQISPQRPLHRREDSQDILRRLARASSNTPSPGNTSNRRPVQQGTPAPIRNPPDTVPAAPVASIPIQTSQRRRSPVPSPPRPQTSSTMKTTGIIETQGRNEEHRIQKETQQVAETPLPPIRQLNPKTPVVTGAWIDTPKPVTSRPTSLQESDPSNSTVPKPPVSKETVSSNASRPSSIKETVANDGPGSPAKKAAQAAVQRARQDELKELAPQLVPAVFPSFPSSALSAVIDEARHHQGTDTDELYGEATIESLADLISPHDDHSIQELDEDTLDQLELPTEKPKTAAEKSRLAELMTLKSMNKKLNQTKSSIRSVSHGIQGLQKHMHDSAEKEEEKGDQQPQAQVVVCEAHVHPFSDLLRSLKSSFYFRDEDGRLKLGRFGLFLTVFLIWFITEFFMWYVSILPLITHVLMYTKKPSLLSLCIRHHNVRLRYRSRRARVSLCSPNHDSPTFPTLMETTFEHCDHICTFCVA
jgi:hypothetical protein